MKLISMTDFVLTQQEKYKSDRFYYAQFKDTVVNYATFLKQPLKLEMFVPCDEDGNVLEEPIIRFDGGYDIDEVEIYQQSKERVLFEGFEVENDLLIIPNFGKQEIKNIKGLTIEALTEFEIELTPTAIKQIQP